MVVPKTAMTKIVRGMWDILYADDDCIASWSESRLAKGIAMDVEVSEVIGLTVSDKKSERMVKPAGGLWRWSGATPMPLGSGTPRKKKLSTSVAASPKHQTIASRSTNSSVSPCSASRKRKGGLRPAASASEDQGLPVQGQGDEDSDVRARHVNPMATPLRKPVRHHHQMLLRLCTATKRHTS